MKGQTLAWRRQRAFARAIALTWKRFHSIELGLSPDAEVQTLTFLDTHARTEQADRISEGMANDGTLFLCERNILLDAARRIREEQ